MRTGLSLGINAHRRPPGGGGGAPPATNLTIWTLRDTGTFDAPSGGSPVADGGGVGRWEDQSGNGNHLTQATAGQRLQRFAAGQCLTQYVEAFQTIGAAGVSANARDFSLFAVVRPLTLNTTYNGSVGQQYHTLAGSKSGAAFNLNYDGNAGAAAGKLGVFDGSFRVSALKVPTSLCLLGVVGTAAGLTFVVNGSGDTLSPMPAGTISGLDVGSGAAPDFPFLGEWHEFLLYSAALGAPDLAALRTYAQSRGCVFDGPNVLAVEGDSISTGAIAPQNRDWLRQMNISGRGAALQYNCSVGGRTLATIASENRSGGYYAAGKTNVLVVFAGTNDLALNGTTGAAAHAILSAFCTDRRAQGYKVVVVTMLPRGGVETQRQAFNNAIRANWTSYADALADVETLAMGAAGANTDTAKYNPDQVHPNTAGHADLAGLIGPAVVSQLSA